MALTIDSYGPQARANINPAAMDCGNVIAEVPAVMELAALAQNKTVAVAKIPAGAFVIGLRYAYDALGATTGINFGLQSADGTVFDADFFTAVADTSTAGHGATGCVMPYATHDDTYVTLTQTGAGTATGTVSAIPEYVFQNLAT